MESADACVARAAVCSCVFALAAPPVAPPVAPVAPPPRCPVECRVRRAVARRPPRVVREILPCAVVPPGRQPARRERVREDRRRWRGPCARVRHPGSDRRTSAGAGGCWSIRMDGVVWIFPRGSLTHHTGTLEPLAPGVVTDPFYNSWSRNRSRSAQRVSRRPGRRRRVDLGCILGVTTGSECERIATPMCRARSTVKPTGHGSFLAAHGPTVAQCVGAGKRGSNLLNHLPRMVLARWERQRMPPRFAGVWPRRMQRRDSSNSP